MAITSVGSRGARWGRTHKHAQTPWTKPAMLDCWQLIWRQLRPRRSWIYSSAPLPTGVFLITSPSDRGVEEGRRGCTVKSEERREVGVGWGENQKNRWRYNGLRAGPAGGELCRDFTGLEGVYGWTDSFMSLCVCVHVRLQCVRPVHLQAPASLLPTSAAASQLHH